MASVTVVEETIAYPKYTGPTELFINNKWVPSVNGKKLKTINPATEEIIASVSFADKVDVNLAVKAARAAFESKEWSGMDSAKRRDLMLKLADLLEKNIEKFMLWESIDNGKPLGDIKIVDAVQWLGCLRYYAGCADKISGKTIPMNDEFLVYTTREPVGVCGQIIPWNFPLLMAMWKIAPALAAGNTIVLKVSEKTPLTGLMFCDLIKEAGFPAGVVNVISGDGSTGECMTAHPDIDKICFTGSSATGKKILASCATTLKRTSLEMGGKSPMLIFEDCDFEQAVNAACMGVYFNMGQCCCAGTRVFVQDTIYDKFLKACVDNVQSRKVLCGLSKNYSFGCQGPIVDKIQFDRVMNYIKSGKEQGAKLACGGARKGTKGYFIKPTIFTDVQDNMKIAKEEIFGPVMSIFKFKSIDEAVKRANATCYGLGAGVCTKDITKAHRIAKRIKAGTVWINCYNVLDTRIPFGGFKQSGHGRDLSEYALEHYTEVKANIVSLAQS